MTMQYITPSNILRKVRQVLGAGAFQTPWLEQDGAQVVTPGGLLNRRAALDGRVFTGNMAAAGAVLPIYSNTAQVFGIWNPLGSGVNVVPLRLGMTWVQTTGAAAGFVLAFTLQAPAAVGTGLQITAFTDGVLNTTIFNGLVGSQVSPKARFTPSAATVVAPVIGRHLGINQDVEPATGAVQLFNNAGDYKFDGSLVLPPGTAMWLAGNIAQLKTIAASLTWAEEEV